MDVILQALENAKLYNPEDTSDTELSVYCTHTPVMKTIAEWGSRLPHGVLRDGVVRRDFELRPPTIQVDLDVGALVSAGNFREHIGRRIAAVCATVCEEIAGVKMGKPSQQAMDLIQTMTPADVFYILTYRACLKNRGKVPIPRINAACPHCGTDVGQLKQPSMDGMRVGVHEWEVLTPPTAAVKLSNPFQNGNETIEAVAVQPVRWAMHVGMCANSSDISNNELLQQLAIEGGIVGYRTTGGNVSKTSIPQSVLRGRLTAWDAEALGQAAYTTWGGLLWSVPVKHDCGEEIEVPFDWRSRLL